MKAIASAIKGLRYILKYAKYVLVLVAVAEFAIEKIKELHPDIETEPTK